MEKAATFASNARHMSLIPAHLQVLDRTRKGEGEGKGEGQGKGEGKEGALSEYIELSHSMPELPEMELEKPAAKKSGDKNFIEIMKEVCGV